ncbi:apolipoprotein N-acyltransferase [bacterium]|nr:MAG: apolipoprotein N-acyltransferase [bacterium]
MIAPLLSAILLALATMLPWGAPLTLVALVPLLSALRHPAPRWTGWKLGYLFGLVYGFAQLAWIFSLTAKWTESAVLALVPYLLAVALFAIYFGLFGWLSRKLFEADRAWAIPFLWAGVEVFRSYIPVFAFPWGLLATPWHVLPFAMKPAAIGTIYAVSALAAWINLAIAFRSSRMGTTAAVTAGLAMIPCQPAATRQIDVAVVQPGVDMAYGDPRLIEGKLGLAIDRQLASIIGTDLIVLPEGIARGGSHLPPQTPFRVPRSAILFGGHRGSGPYFQSAFAWDGRVWRVIDKTRLVIFGEFVPGRDLFPFLQAFKLPAGDLTAGTEGVKSLPFSFGEVGPILCFEALFPDIAARQSANGAQLLAVMSIDDWFMGTNAPEQLRAAAAWRAVENQMPVLRAGTMGRSEIVEASGRVLEDGGYGSPKVLRARVGLPAQKSPPWLLTLFPLLAVGVSLLIPWLPRRGRRSSDTPGSDPTLESAAPL